MKPYIKLTAVVTAFLLLTGCTGDTTTPEGTTNNPSPEIQYPQENQQQSTIPPQQQGIGYEQDLSDYLFAESVFSHNENIKKEFYLTKQNQDGYFEPSQKYIRQQESAYNDYGDTVINIFENGNIKEHYTINENLIDVLFYQNKVVSEETQYRRFFKLKEDMYRVPGSAACVYENILNNFDISEVIPKQANPNNYNDDITSFYEVLHIFCGTAQGIKIDRYYAKGWGIIAEVYQNIDGSIDYSVLKTSSYSGY